MSSASSSPARLWLWPAILGLVTGFGLVCALVADGPWNVAGAGCLAAPSLLSLSLIGRFLGAPSLTRRP